MKVSLNLAQQYSNVDLITIPREEILQRIGAQLGAVEEVIDWAPKFEGAVIVRVVTCEKHPNADKLSLCRVDDGGVIQGVERGGDGLVQVVCGAPNVRADMYAVWLSPGVIVPSTRDTEPFILEAREIRGTVSNGMMASPKELGISDSHEGILEIRPIDVGREPQPGEPLTSYFGLDDFVIECENKMFTHRPDCFGNLGVAREIAGIFGLKFQSPDWYKNTPSFEKRSDLPLQAGNEASAMVSRFMVVAMQNITVKPSPSWLQAVLARVGIKSINNVVDVTNYVMHLTGQPLHAFDYDKLRERSENMSIHPRMGRTGEKLRLLGGKEIEVTENDIVIATDKQAVALAGVMGGAETEVDENTKNIVLEVATFDMYNIRRTSMRHGLFTDAVTRFTKGQSPLQNEVVIAYAMRQLTDLAGADQASDVFDVRSEELDKFIRREVRTENGFINNVLGSSLSNQEILDLLANVEIEGYVDEGIDPGRPQDTPRKEILLYIPFWRMDLESEEDIAEEVGRLYGFDKLPVALPKRSANPARKNALNTYKQHLRNSLKSYGANEVLTYSFVHGDIMRKTGSDPDKWAYHLRNALSPDLQYFRTSLMPSLLAKVHQNVKAQAGDDNNQFALFEIGKAHTIDHKEDGLPVQMERLALVVTADDKTAKAKQSGVAYYIAKKYLDGITDNQVVYQELDNTDYPLTAPYQVGRSALVVVGGDVFGVIGEFAPKVRASLKLPEFTAGFELDIQALQKYLQPKKYQPLPTFPGISQDYTHETSAETRWIDVYVGLEAALEQANQEGYKFTIEPLDIFKANDSTKRLTFRIFFNHPSKTMTTDEATALLVQASQVLRDNQSNGES